MATSSTLRLNAILTLFAFFTLVAFPQKGSGQNNPLNEDHVTWDYITPTLEGSPGETVTFQFRANLKPKVHLYTTRTYPDSMLGPSPTEMSAGGSRLVKRSGGLKASKVPITKKDENFEGLETAFWEGKVNFSVPFTISEDATPGSVEEAWVNLYYMTCDDNTCKPPLDSKFTFKVKVVGDVSMDTAAVRDSIVREIAAANERIVEGVSQLFTMQWEGGEGEPAVAGTDEDEVAGDEGEVELAGATGEESVEQGEGGVGERRQTYNQEIEEKQKESLWLYILAAMGAGLFALTTPCVYPMIPITVSFFTKREQNSHWQAIRDAIVYGAGIMLTFTGLGVVITALAGPTAVGSMATNPWVNIVVAAIFVAFAFSLFGLFEIQVPSSILNKLNAKANQEGGGMTAILLMGLVFALTSFTCTVPFVGPTLYQLSTGGEWFLPIVGMLAFSFVFALPFVLLAIFPSLMKALPKSGGWLNAVKVTMGFVEIAAAMKFLSNTDLVWNWGFLTREVVLAVWIALAIFAFLYLLGRFRLAHDVPLDKIGVIRMMFSAGFLAIGLWLLTGLFGSPLGTLDALLPPQEYPGIGNTSILATIRPDEGEKREEVQNSAQTDEVDSPPNGSSGGNESVVERTKGPWIRAEGMDWVKDDYPDALAEAKATGKPIFIDFTGYTCTNCRWMETNIFTKKDVQELMKEYVLVRLYTDRREESNERNRQMQIDRFKTIDLPYYVVVTPNDEVVDETVFTRDVDAFKSFLKRGLATVDRMPDDVAMKN